MRKFPKSFNTKYDVELCLELFPEKTKNMLQLALGGYKGWVCTGSFNTEAECIKDETHDYFKSETEEGVTWIQKEFMVVPGNMIDRLGYTVAEIEEIVTNINK